MMDFFVRNDTCYYVRHRSQRKQAEQSEKPMADAPAK